MVGPCLTLTGRFRFGDAILFDQIKLRLPLGQWTCLLGRSGIGKSTLLRLLAGLPTGGEFDGQIAMSDASSPPKTVAYMAQSDLLAPWLNVLDNVVLGARLRGESPDRDRAMAMLERVGLAGDADKRPAQLSGGMRQRAALARTLMEQAPLVLLDEPFSALDARTRAEMQELAFELLCHATVFLATHDPGEAARLSHQILILDAGRLSEQPVPDSDPIRSGDATDTLRAQAALLRELRRSDPVTSR